MNKESIKILNMQRHGEKKLNVTDYSWADSLTTLPVALSEVHDITCSFPVVFTDEEKPRLVMVTAAGNGRNLGLDAEGKWTERYVPGFLRRYPFYLSRVPGKEGEEEQMVLAIDESSGCMNDKEGVPLFEDGQPAPYVRQMVTFIGTLEKEMLATAEMGKEFKDAGILETKEFTLEQNGEKKVLVEGFLAVNREKLNELSDYRLAKWARLGYIGIIDQHFHSFKNMRRLLEKAYA